MDWIDGHNQFIGLLMEGKKMPDIDRAVEKIQQAYFDICDLLNGNSYTNIGYEDRTDFLLVMRDHLLQAEMYLKDRLTEENNNA